MILIEVAKRIPRQLFKTHAGLFVCGLVLALIIAFVIVFEAPQKWQSATMLAYQLLGTLISFVSILEQRRAMSAESLGRLLLEWTRAFVPRTINVSVNERIEASDRFFAHGVVRSPRPNSDAPHAQHIQSLWDALEKIQMDVSTLQGGLHQHRTDTEIAISQVRETFSQEVKQSETRLVKALTDSPYAVFFGLWLVIVSTAFQLSAELSK